MPLRSSRSGSPGSHYSPRPRRAPTTNLSFSSLLSRSRGTPRCGEFSLRGNVVVTYERFRLTSPALLLQRTPSGINVQGPGEVVFCPCPNPPVAVGFEGGLVAPPADLILRRPKLLVGGVTVLAFPWFWLRAPTRLGVLPPSIVWRGEEGLLLGDGVHIPWRDGDQFDELDLTAAGYLKGGIELSARLRTPRSTARVRWDHLGSDLLAIDGQGAYPQGERSVLAWDVDAIRGARARSGAPTLDEAARGYDRAAGEVGLRLGEGVRLGVGVRAVGARGGFGPSERIAWGPRMTLGLGGALGNSSAWNVVSTAAILEDAALGPTQWARAAGGLDLFARPGFLVTRLSLRESITAGQTATDSGFDASSAARVELSAPLARVFPDENAPLVHVIEPRISAAVVASRTSGSYWGQVARQPALASGQIALTSVGVRSAWGGSSVTRGGASKPTSARWRPCTR